MMKTMGKIKIIIIIKTLLKEKQKSKKKNNKQTNTITTNKTLIYNRQNTYRGRQRKKNYLFITSKL